MSIWLSLLLFVVEHLPQLIELIKTIIALLHKVPAGQRAGFIAKLMAAYRTLRATGDAGPLKQLHDELAKLFPLS